MSTARGQKKRDALNGPVKVVSKMRKCNKCGKEKPLEEFDKRKASKDGRSAQCKECRREYQRKWCEKHYGKKPIAIPQKPVNDCPTGHAVTSYYDPFRYCWVEGPQPTEEPEEEEEKPKFSVNQYVLIEHNGKVKGAHLVAKCSDEYSTKWVVELCNWRRTKIIVSEDNMYTEDAC